MTNFTTATNGNTSKTFKNPTSTRSRLNIFKFLSAFALVMLLGVNGLTGQTNPTAQSLPYTQNFGSATFNTMPTGMAAWNNFGSNLTTQSNAEASIAGGNVTVAVATTSQTTGAVYGYAVSSNARAYIQQSSNTANGTNQIVVAINTGSGVTSVDLSYQLEMINGGAATQDYGLELQYRAGTSGSWTNVTGSAITFGAVTSYTTTTLNYTISGLSASTAYQIRWIVWRPTGSSSSKGVGIDNISISASTAGTDYFWNGNGGSPLSANFNTGPWSASASTSAALAWPGTGTNNANFSNTQGGTVTMPTTYNTTPNNVILGSGNYIFSTAASTPSTLSSPINLNANNLTLSPNATSAALTLSGTISGTSGSLTTTTGSIVLSGANTFTGATTINSGTLRVSADNNLGAGSLSLNGGTLATTTGFTSAKAVGIASSSTSNITAGQTLTLSGVLSGSSALLVNGGGNGSTTGGVLALTGTSNTYSGAFTIGNSDGTGAAQLNLSAITNLSNNPITVYSNSQLNIPSLSSVTFNPSGALTLNGIGTLSNSGAIRVLTPTSVAWSGPVTIGSSGATVSVSSSGSNNFTLSGATTFSGTLTKAGGGVLTLSSASNSGSGATTIGNGTVTVSSGSALGTGDLSMAQTSTNATNLNLNNTSQSTGNLSSSWTATTGTIAQTITLGSGHTLTINQSGTSTYGAGAVTTLSSILAGSGGISKSGTGALTLTSANTFSGGTAITNGTLTLGASNVLADAGAVNVNGGILNSSGAFTETIGALTLTSGSINGATGTLTPSSMAVQAGTIDVILAGSGVMTKSTSGTVFLTNVNTYSGGTTINAGILSANGPNRLGATSGALTINSGTFQLTTTSISSGRAISLGSASSTFDVASGIVYTTSSGGVFSSTGSLNKTGAGTLALAIANTYSGSTNINGGTIRLNAANVLPSTELFLDGGTFSTGATTGFYETVGTLNLNSTGTIALGTGAHTLTFSASNGVTWAGTALTVTGWTGTAATSGTAGKIFVGSSATGLTAGQLAKITFSGYAGVTATILSTGEIVPDVSILPTIFTVGTLSSVNTTYGTASTTPTTFTASGTNLTADISISAPSGFEISQTVGGASGYATTQTLTQSGGTVSTTTIYVRLAATSTVAGSPYTGNIALTSTGATPVNVATVSSTVAGRELTISGLSASAKTYDGTTATSVTVGALAFVGLQNGDAATVTGSPTYAFATSGAGSAKAITQTGSYGASFTSGVIGNYTITQPTLTADINTVAITLTASAQSKNFGAVSATSGATSFSITSGALVGSENISTVTLAYSGSPAGNLATATVGAYTITPSAAVFSVGTSSNYSITYSIGTLTINAIAASAPTGIVITPSNIQLSVAFAAASDGGSTITSYKYSTDGGSTFLTRQTGSTGTPIVITTLSSDGTTPLTNGVTYQIQIRAVTGFGDGTATATTSGTPAIINSSVTAWINASNATAWHSGSNWSPSTVPSGSVVAQWNNTGSATGCGINLGTGIPSILGLEVGSTRSRSLLLGSSAGTGSMTLNGGIINSISDVVIRNASNSLFTIAASNGGGTLGITLANTTNNKVSIDGTGAITISLVIAGGSSNPLTKIGVGAGVLSLTGANTYTGLTTVTEGTLQLNRTGGTTIPNTNNVTINGGTLQVSSNQTLNNVTLTSGTLIIDPGVTLTINGTITRTSGVIRGSATSNLVITGASGAIAFDQTTPGTTNVLKNLTISGSGTTTLGNALNITGGTTFGVVTVGTGATLATGGNLTLESDGSGTACIGNSAGSVTGNVSVKRFIASSGRRFRFLSSPIASSSNLTIADWMTQFYVTGPGTGSTLGAANSNGWHTTQANINAATVTTTSIRTYNESLTTGDLNTGWENLTGTSQALTPGQGFRTFIRGAIPNTGQLNGTVTSQSAVTLTLTGTINSGNINGNPTFTSSGTAANDGWNLLGNPYPAAYNWNAHFDANVGVEIANIDATIYIYDGTANSYKSYNASTNSGTLTNGIIPSGAGFFVQANAASPILVFKETYKTTTAPIALHKTTLNDEFTIKFFKEETESDEIIVKMLEGATLNKDGYDINKLGNENLNLSAYGADDKLLTLSAIPFVTEETKIKLNVEATEVGTYKFDFKNIANFDAGVSVSLFDRYTNKTTDVKANTVYTFEMGAGVNQWGKNRFELILNGKATTGVNNTIANKAANTILSVYPNPATDVLNISLSNGTAIETVNIYNISGKLVNSTKLNGNQIDISQLNNGVYMVEVLTANGTFKTRFVK